MIAFSRQSPPMCSPLRSAFEERDQLIGGLEGAAPQMWRNDRLHGVELLGRIVLLSTDGVGTSEIVRRTGKSKTCVWRWQERFMQEGYDGHLRDKTRPSCIPSLGSKTSPSAS